MLSAIVGLVALLALAWWLAPRASVDDPMAEAAPEVSARSGASARAPTADPAREMASPDAEELGSSAMIEGCGSRVGADGGRFVAPAVTERCAVRVVIRNGGAESRGPARWIEPSQSGAEVQLEVPETPAWEPPVPPRWLDGGNEGLTPQERRDQRLEYLKGVLAEGKMTPEQAALTRETVERLERDRFE